MVSVDGHERHREPAPLTGGITASATTFRIQCADCNAFMGRMPEELVSAIRKSPVLEQRFKLQCRRCRRLVRANYTVT